MRTSYSASWKILTVLWILEDRREAAEVQVGEGVDEPVLAAGGDLDQADLVPVAEEGVGLRVDRDGVVAVDGLEEAAAARPRSAPAWEGGGLRSAGPWADHTTSAPPHASASAPRGCHRRRRPPDRRHHGARPWGGTNEAGQPAAPTAGDWGQAQRRPSGRPSCKPGGGPNEGRPACPVGRSGADARAPSAVSGRALKGRDGEDDGT